MLIPFFALLWIIAGTILYWRSTHQRLCSIADHKICCHHETDVSAEIHLYAGESLCVWNGAELWPRHDSTGEELYFSSRQGMRNLWPHKCCFTSIPIISSHWPFWQGLIGTGVQQHLEDHKFFIPFVLSADLNILTRKVTCGIVGSTYFRIWDKEFLLYWLQIKRETLAPNH